MFFTSQPGTACLKYNLVPFLFYEELQLSRKITCEYTFYFDLGQIRALQYKNITSYDSDGTIDGLVLIMLVAVIGFIKVLIGLRRFFNSVYITNHYCGHL